MSCDPICVDAIPLLRQPDSCVWEPPPLVAKDGNGAPIYGHYYKCALGWGVLSSVSYDEVFDLRGGNYSFHLPHPYNGTFIDVNAYVDDVKGRMSVKKKGSPAMAGVDMVLSRITVS